jgi:hypothetical protein
MRQKGAAPSLAGRSGGEAPSLRLAICGCTPVSRGFRSGFKEVEISRSLAGRTSFGGCGTSPSTIVLLADFCNSHARSFIPVRHTEEDNAPRRLGRGGLRGEVPCFVVGLVGWIYPCSGDEGGIFKGRDRIRISDKDGYLLRLDGTSPSLPTDMCRVLMQGRCHARRGLRKRVKPPFVRRGSVFTSRRAADLVSFVQMRSSEFGIST